MPETPIIESEPHHWNIRLLLPGLISLIGAAAILFGALYCMIWQPGNATGTSKPAETQSSKNVNTLPEEEEPIHMQDAVLTRNGFTISELNAVASKKIERPILSEETRKSTMEMPDGSEGEIWGGEASYIIANVCEGTLISHSISSGIYSYEEYKELFSKIEELTGGQLAAGCYEDKQLNYLVQVVDFTYSMKKQGWPVLEKFFHDNTGNLVAQVEPVGDSIPQPWESELIVVPTDYPVSHPIGLNVGGKTYTHNIGWEPGVMLGIAHKPIVYLYPEHETDITVRLSNPELVTCSYPRYSGCWNVTAFPDGTLIDEDGRNLYSLYYEAKIENAGEAETIPDGFVVPGNDSADFLEEKLAELGLTSREAEEFIVYWLPKLEASEYNLIHFLVGEEVEDKMGLQISPEPDTRIRILMEYKPLEKPIPIEQQEIQTPKRKGFVLVEWGGTELR